MSKYALLGVNPTSKLVDVVASIDSKFTDEHIDSMMEDGLLVMVTTKENARKVWGTVIDSVYDLVSF